MTDDYLPPPPPRRIPLSVSLRRVNAVPSLPASDPDYESLCRELAAALAPVAEEDIDSDGRGCHWCGAEPKPTTTALEAQAQNHKLLTDAGFYDAVMPERGKILTSLRDQLRRDWLEEETKHTDGCLMLQARAALTKAKEAGLL